MSEIAPSPVAGFDRDPTRSRTLPGFYYFDPEIFERERRRVFHRSWQYVGHVSMLPEPGSYIVRDILDQSVLLLRDRDGEIRGLLQRLPASRPSPARGRRPAECRRHHLPLSRLGL